MSPEPSTPPRSQTVGKLRVVLPACVWDRIAAAMRQLVTRLQSGTSAVAGSDSTRELLEFLARLLQALAERDAAGGVWGYEGGFCRLAELLLDCGEWTTGRLLVETVSDGPCRSPVERSPPPLPASVMQSAREAAAEMDAGTDQVISIGRREKGARSGRKARPGRRKPDTAAQPSLF